MPFTIHADPVPLHCDAEGTIRVAGTRVTLDTIVAHYRQGAASEAIAERFSVLTAADVHAALAYYLRHQEEIDRYLLDRAQTAEGILEELGDNLKNWSEIEPQLRNRSSG